MEKDLALLYVIGLGGAGSRVVLEFAKMIREYKGVDTSKVRFQIFDMAHEPEIIDAMNKGILDDESVKLIPPYLVETAKVKMVSLAEGEKKDWFPRELVPEILTRIRGGQGVERRRPLARLALHTDDIAVTIYNEISHDLGSLVSAYPDEPVLVAIVASLGGGFGSGTFHDIAALVKKAANDIPERPSVTLAGIFILPYGYRTPPPPGVRVEFEEENAMAALAEMFLLKELHMKGTPYREYIPALGELTYEPFDMPFFVSFAGVRATRYDEQFRELDRAIAEFLLTLSLVPFRGGGGKGGIAISENFIEKYNSVHTVMGPGPNKWKPIGMSFRVARLEPRLDKLIKLFHLLEQLEGSGLNINEQRKRLMELEAKLQEMEIEIAKAEAEYKRCLEDVEKAKTYGTSIPEGLMREAMRAAEQVAMFVEQGQLREALESVRRYFEAWEKQYGLLEAYTAVQRLKDRLEMILQLRKEEAAKIRSQIEEIERQIRSLNDELTRLPFYKRLLRKGEYNRRIEELRSKANELRLKLNEIEVAASNLHHFLTMNMNELMAELAQSIRGEELCKSKRERIEELRAKKLELERTVEDMRRAISTAEMSLGQLEYELNKLRDDRDIKKILSLFVPQSSPSREDLLEVERKLYELWKSDPENFTKLPLAVLAKRVNPHALSRIKGEIQKVFGELEFPLLSSSDTREETCFLQCRTKFASSIVVDKEMQTIATHGVRIFIINPEDRELIKDVAKNATPMELSGIGPRIYGLAVYPILSLPCTMEYKVMYEDYIRAKRHYPSLYQRLHVLPVQKMVTMLGLNDIEELLSEPLICSQ